MAAHQYAERPVVRGDVTREIVVARPPVQWNVARLSFRRYQFLTVMRVTGHDAMRPPLWA